MGEGEYLVDEEQEEEQEEGSACCRYSDLMIA